MKFALLSQNSKLLCPFFEMNQIVVGGAQLLALTTIEDAINS